MKNLIIVLIISISFLAKGQEKKPIVPRKSVGKVILNGKKDYTYYALSDVSKTEYKITGPGKLYVNYRVRLPKGEFNSSNFQVNYTRSNNFIGTHKVPELLVGNLKFKSKALTGLPSRAHQETIDVPPGTQVYKFYKHNTNQKVHMRAFYEQHEKPKWTDVISLNPIASKKVRFVKTGKEKIYSSISKNSDFTFSVDDATKIRLIVRPEFSYRMLAETILKIKVSNLSTGENKIYKVNSFKSKKLEFVDERKMTPGTSSTIYLDLEKPINNNDLYAINVVGGAKNAVIRISKDSNSNTMLP